MALLLCKLGSSQPPQACFPASSFPASSACQVTFRAGAACGPPSTARHACLTPPAAHSDNSNTARQKEVIRQGLRVWWSGQCQGATLQSFSALPCYNTAPCDDACTPSPSFVCTCTPCVPPTEPQDAWSGMDSVAVSQATKQYATMQITLQATKLPGSHTSPRPTGKHLCLSRQLA
jgi:hypothetical protein